MEREENNFSKIIVIVSAFFLKYAGIVFYLFILLLVIDFFDGEDDWHSVVAEIYDGCYIEELDDNMQSIYYYPDGDEKGERKYIVDEWEEVIKYASNGKDMVAFHCVYNKFSEDEEEKLVVYNTENEENFSFDTQKDFIEFCEKKKLVLSDWKKMNCGPAYEKINLSNGWTVYDFHENWCVDQVLKGYEVVYEGHVSEITEKENGVVNFRLIVPYGADLEFSDSNEGLDVSEEPVAEYKGELFTTMDICYDEILILNTVTGEVRVKGE